MGYGRLDSSEEEIMEATSSVDSETEILIQEALDRLKEEANSSAPVLGYSVPFAFGNVLLIIWGTVLVNVM